tara:strand:- start:617 stop:994 length:378 start_codon:yes stop_codon:yes gene_type:complete
LIKEIFGIELLVQNHSTVTKSLSREDYSRRKVNLLFDVNITDKNLNNYFYSEHQQYLYDTSKKLYGKGLGYRKISNWFNEHNIKTPRGSEFKGNYVFSIFKKGKIREERLNRESEWKIGEVKLKI